MTYVSGKSVDHLFSHEWIVYDLIDELFIDSCLRGEGRHLYSNLIM